MELHKTKFSACLSIFLYLGLLCISFTLMAPKVTPTTLSLFKTNETDKQALLKFKKEITIDSHGILTSWNDSAHFCFWYGITCSKIHERVVSLDLQGLNLHGSISPHIGNLTFLRFINLQQNSFFGELPQQVGQLFRLQHFNISNNTLLGKIPSQLFNCSELRIVTLGRNKLVGKIPLEIGSLKKLVLLDLASNNLTGTVPSSIGNLSSLKYFSVGTNNLEGSVPNEIGLLKSLSVLVIGVNKLSGVLPLSLYNISSLTKISAVVNRLNGTLPTNFGFSFPNLEWFTISENEFSGHIPISLSNSSNIQVLSLSRNYFVGKIPSNIGSLLNLVRLGISENNLESNSTNNLEFLTSLTNCSQLEDLDFSKNNFVGVLPPSLANLSSQLGALYLDTNMFHGTIPLGFEKYTNLHTLNMGRNFFTGSIPSYFGKFHNMQGMFLSSNRFSKPIPSSIGNLTQLVQLYLWNNMLNGTIPLSIVNCHSLQYLDIAENKLTGSIPKSLLNDLSSLLYLNLSCNSLLGNLPLESGSFKPLTILAISWNNLRGRIPQAIGDYTSLEYLYLQGNSFDGMLPSSLTSLKGLTNLDLSQNNLSGKIPQGLEKLLFLVYLNLSFNNFEGEVPTKGVFQNSTASLLKGNSKLCGGAMELKFPKCSIEAKRHKGMSRVRKLAIIISSVLVFLTVLSIFVTLFWKRILKRSHSVPTRDNLHQIYLPKVSYRALHIATQGFSPNNLIGVGNFGFVYKGTLDEQGVVAVKVFNLQQRAASKSYMAECKVLRSIRHRNLVKIITACSSVDYHGNEFKALVYRFMENESLEKWLHPKINRESHLKNLNFLHRLNIAIDVAHGLNYLHHHCEPPIVHCDLKPDNILLDSDMVAHVGDFGLARLLIDTSGVSQNQSSTIGLKGSVGYAAPEYGIGGEATKNGDSYSYGILILEMFTGKRPTDEMFKDGLNIHNFVKTTLLEGLILQIVDPRILEEVEALTVVDARLETTSENSVQMISRKAQRCLSCVIEIGLACSEESPKQRMEMEQVIKELHLVKISFLEVV